ncbi:hypothetical protein DC094_12310 [Pelagibaculum spongiae]|uniref:Uncharacterized protein n=1 Tax=Pelagibaculum spongiae TaxID=2080658 RepID=A0A2V1GUN3_9GAMM|nr:hypothetical protein DC094_12310 [Pelagibaculum spongiae]
MPIHCLIIASQSFFYDQLKIFNFLNCKALLIIASQSFFYDQLKIFNFLNCKALANISQPLKLAGVESNY